MSRLRARSFPLLPWALALVVGCATESAFERSFDRSPERSSEGSSTRSTSQELRTSAGKGGFAGWDRLVKALPRLASGGSGCQGAQQDRDDQGSALVLPATCLFPDGKTTIGPPSRPAIDAIAAELKSAPDREFWIAVTAPARSGAASDQFTRERAAAIVNALMAAGVPPNRLAALLGPGGDAAQTPPRLAGTPLASVATVEIVAAPLPP